MQSLAKVLFALVLATSVGADPLVGAWETRTDDGKTGSWIVDDEHFAIAWYRTDPAEFLFTKGGTWSREDDGSIALTWEFHTADPSFVGLTNRLEVGIEDATLMAGGSEWTRVDDGSPGDLRGTWLMTGRKRDGELSHRTPGDRRTMKILSGTRFQWIAYNVATREFFGSGGGTYTTEDDTYVEQIEFFSRNNQKAGLSLPFRYELVDGVWHHDGKTTSGNPMYEIWTRRADVGI